MDPSLKTMSNPDRAAVFLLSNSTGSCVAHMKGPHVAGQHADSAAGYWASKTLPWSENIMIHLHIFNSDILTQTQS